MTEETSPWIFEKFLSGMEATHGKPWWSRPSTDNPANHFDGPIPVEAVEKLFGFDVNLAKVWVEDKNGNMFLAEEFLAAVPDNQNACYAIHSKAFSMTGHQYREWLIEGPAKVVNGCVGISNAGLLKNGAQAWVNISTPEEWKTPQGVDFRPQLLWTTAVDGTIASTVKETDVLSVCDNTRAAALAAKGLSYKVKHTKNSVFKLEDAKAALHLLEQNAEAFAAEIATLCELKVTEQQFQTFMSKLVPLPEKKDLDLNKRDYSTRTATIAANKREALNTLYRLDGRVAPWKGTAFGVLQMVNTHTTHVAAQRGATEGRAARNMENIISGRLFDADADAMALLSKICDWNLNREYQFA
jgi:phage/plasmid-like protein (TIGR03299 family)